MSKGNILIVEDNMDTYELVHFILEKNGFETFLAMNGRDGVTAAQKQKPDLIIMDLSMPEMDGWTATTLIKQDKTISSIPLITLTAHALPGDRQRAMDAGSDEYITKPMDLDDLVETVSYWINKR
jgi:CheY-like chemotaxis protein